MTSSLRRLRLPAALVALASVAFGLLRCALPPLPPGPQAPPTRVGLLRGAFLRVPEEAGLPTGTIVSQMRQLNFNAVILTSSATPSGEHIAERVALAIDLQRDLDADVLIGTYTDPALQDGVPMEYLLEVPAVAPAECWPGGPKVDPGAPMIERLRRCSAEVSLRIVTALAAAGASPRIGCHVAYTTELTSEMSDGGAAALGDYFRGAASSCSDVGRPVSVASILTNRLGNDPDRAGIVMRGSLMDSGVGLLVVNDGSGYLTRSVHPPGAADYVTGSVRLPGAPAADYQGVRNGIIDRVPTAVWAGLEVFECDAGRCSSGPPTNIASLIDQLCAARARVNGIVVDEYLEDFAFDGGAALREEYLTWVDAGAPCN